MSISKHGWLTILLFGSVWGGLEAIVTALMGGADVTVIPRSVILALIALMILTYARLSLPGRGTTLAIGIVAAGFKFLGLPDMYNCQLAAVIGQAIVLEAAFSLAESRGRTLSEGRLAMVVLVSGYVNAITFCFAQAYVFGNHWWLDRGIGGLIEWVAVNGTQAVLAGLIGAGLASLACRFVPYRRLSQVSPLAFRSAALVVSASFWMLGVILIRA